MKMEVRSVDIRSQKSWNKKSEVESKKSEVSSQKSEVRRK